MVKNPSAMQEMEMQVQSLGWEDSMEEEMSTHSSTLALGNPMDSGAWQATVQGVAKRSAMTEQLSMLVCKKLSWAYETHIGG